MKIQLGCFIGHNAGDIYDTSLGPAAWVGVCAQVCCHLLSRPDNADSGSRICRRQTAECVAHGFRFRVPGTPNPSSAPPSFLALVCSVSPRMTDGPTPQTHARARSVSSDTLKAFQDLPPGSQMMPV